MVVSKEMEEFMVADGGTETTSTYRRGARWDGACDKRLIVLPEIFLFEDGQDERSGEAGIRSKRAETGGGRVVSLTTAM